MLIKIEEIIQSIIIRYQINKNYYPEIEKLMSKTLNLKPDHDSASNWIDVMLTILNAKPNSFGAKYYINIINEIKSKVNSFINNANELNEFLIPILCKIDNLKFDSLKTLELHKMFLLNILKDNKYMNYKTIVIISNSNILSDLKKIFIKKPFLNIGSDLNNLPNAKTIKIFIDYVKKNNIKLINTQEESKEYLDAILNLNDNNSDLLETLFSYFIESSIYCNKSSIYYNNSIITDITNSKIDNNLKIKLYLKLLNQISKEKIFLKTNLDLSTLDNLEYFREHILDSVKYIDIYLLSNIISSNNLDKETKLYYFNQIIEFNNKTDIFYLKAYKLYDYINIIDINRSKDFIDDEIFKEAVFFTLMKSKKLTSLDFILRILFNQPISKDQNLISDELTLKLCKKTFENAKENNIDLFKTDPEDTDYEINLIDLIILNKDESNFIKKCIIMPNIKLIQEHIIEYIKDYLSSYLANQPKEKQQEYLRCFKEYENSKYYDYILKFFYDQESDSYPAFNKCNILINEPLEAAELIHQENNSSKMFTPASSYEGNISECFTLDANHDGDSLASSYEGNISECFTLDANHDGDSLEIVNSKHLNHNQDDNHNLNPIAIEIYP
ncbi:MAG: hypothetical protein U1E31_02525 [Rickettsiales bacterium]